MPKCGSRKEQVLPARQNLTTCAARAAGEKARTLREVPPAHAAARNHPADGGMKFVVAERDRMAGRYVNVVMPAYHLAEAAAIRKLVSVRHILGY